MEETVQKKRLNFTIPKDSYEDLKQISTKSGLTVSEIMREAIRIYKWAKIEAGRGNIIVSKSDEANGMETRVIL
jgi:hypothetical protein